MSEPLASWLVLIFRLVNALMVVWTVVGVLAKCTTGRQHTAWPHGDATYLHSGRAAVMCLAPSGPSSLLLISKLVMALMVETPLA